jgi:WD40 repeat protein
VWRLTLSPGGRWALADGFAIDLWAPRTVEPPDARRAPVPGWGMAMFTPDGKRVLSAGYEPTLTLWEIGSGKVLQRLDCGAPAECVTLAADGRHVLTGHPDGRLTLWDLGEGAAVRSLDRPNTDPGPSHAVVCVRFLGSPGRALVVGDAGRSLWLWDVTGGKPVRSFEGFEGHGLVDVSPDGGWFLTQCYAEAAPGPVDLVLWDVRADHPPRRVGRHRFPLLAGAFLPGGSVALTLDEDGGVRRWQLPGGKELWAWQLERGSPMTAAALFADGSRAVTGHRNGSARVWDLNRKRYLGTVREGGYVADDSAP